MRRFITDIKFAGPYIYALRHWKNVQAGGEPIPAYRAVGQFVEVPDHHEPYITLAEFHENQRTLELNRFTPKHSHLGRGDALIQGVCHCDRHGRVLAVQYSSRPKRKSWRLQCQGDLLRGGRTCVSFPGPPLEETIGRAVLERLDSNVVEAARRCWKEQRLDWRRLHAGANEQAQRQEALVARLRRRIIEDDGTRPHLRVMFDDEYEKEARRLVALRAEAAKQQVPEDPFTEATWAELVRLCSDRHAIWSAKTTTDQDRKQLIRILVARVVVELVEPERIVCRIEWADGGAATRLEVLRSAHYWALLWEWHLEGVSPQESVRRLAEMGARTQHGNLWTLPTVRTTLAIKAKRETQSESGVGAPPVVRRALTEMRTLAAAGLASGEIAHRLNAKGLFTRFQRPWSATSVERALAEKTRKQGPTDQATAGRAQAVD